MSNSGVLGFDGIHAADDAPGNSRSRQCVHPIELADACGAWKAAAPDRRRG